MASSIWISVFQWFAGIGFFLAILLLTTRKKRGLRTIWIASLVFLFALCLTHFTNIWAGNRQATLYLAGVWVLASYLFGPLLYLYKKHQQKPFSYRDIWHFAPFIVMFCFWLPYPFLPLAAKVETLQNGRLFHADIISLPIGTWLNLGWLMVMHQAVYAYLFWRDHQIAESTDKAGHSYRLDRQLFLLFSLFIIAQLAYYALVDLNLMQPIWDYHISLVMCISIYWIGVAVYRYPRVLELWPSRQRYQQSALTTNQSEVISQKVKAHVYEKELYLDSQLRLAKVAEDLGLSIHQISQAINEQFDCTFPTWLNRFRLDYAHQLLLETNLPIKAVAYQAGFNNLTTFYNVFKEAYEMTPVAYRKANVKAAS